MSSSAHSLCVIGASVWQYYGPLFLGGVSATFFSGMTTVQAIIYVKLYPKDKKYLKALVFVVWAIDLTQTGLTWNTLWFYLVRNFGDFTKLDDIPIPLTMVAILGWITSMLVQSCYLYRIFWLSNRSFWIAASIGILMTIRLTWIIECSVEMIHLNKFTLFLTQYKWLVTLGLCFSTMVDVTITATLVFLLFIRGRSCIGVGNQVVMVTDLGEILDSLILYTLELGSVTGVMTILSLIFWLRLDNHMVFLGLYTSLGKLYSNCLMAMLNMRYSLRQKRPMTLLACEGSTQSWRPHPQAMIPRPDSSLPSLVKLEPVHCVDISQSIQCADGSYDARKRWSL